MVRYSRVCGTSVSLEIEMNLMHGQETATSVYACAQSFSIFLLLIYATIIFNVIIVIIKKVNNN